MSQAPQEPAPSPSFGQQGNLGELLTFRKMITPVVIQVLFWVIVALCVISALVAFASGTAAGVLGGLFMLILGPVFARVYCEMIIVFFRMRDLLEEIRDNTKR